MSGPSNPWWTHSYLAFNSHWSEQAVNIPSFCIYAWLRWSVLQITFLAGFIVADLMCGALLSQKKKKKKKSECRCKQTGAKVSRRGHASSSPKQLYANELGPIPASHMTRPRTHSQNLLVNFLFRGINLLLLWHQGWGCCTQCPAKKAYRNRVTVHCTSMLEVLHVLIWTENLAFVGFIWMVCVVCMHFQLCLTTEWYSNILCWIICSQPWQN